MKFSDQLGRGVISRLESFLFMLSLIALVSQPEILTAADGPTRSDSASLANTTSPKIENAPTKVVAYKVRDILAKIRNERAMNGPEAKGFLKTRLSRAVSTQVTNSDRIAIPKSVSWSGSQLVVDATAAGHRQIADALAAIREFDTSEFAIEIRFLTFNDNLQDKLDEQNLKLPDWKSALSELPDTALSGTSTTQLKEFYRPLEKHDRTHFARAKSIIETDIPVRYRIMEKEQGEKLMALSLGHRVRVVQPFPIATVFNGQTAFVSDTAPTPLVAGEKEVKPNSFESQYRTASEGTTMQLKPTVDQHNMIHLAFSAGFLKVGSADIYRLAQPKAEQIPNVQTYRFDGGVDLKPGQWLMLDSIKTLSEARPDDRSTLEVFWDRLTGAEESKAPDTCQLVLMLRVEKISPGMPKPKTEQGFSRSEQVTRR